MRVLTGCLASCDQLERMKHTVKELQKQIHEAEKEVRRMRKEK